MDGLQHAGTVLARFTFVQLQLCLTTLDLLGCKRAAMQLELAIHTMRDELEEHASLSHFQPGEDFAEMDAQIAEMFDKRYFSRQP